MYAYTYGKEQPGEFVIPPKRRVAGASIGILLLDVPSVMVPGDVNNATTYDFPVLYKVLKGVDTKRLGKADPSILGKLIHGARELEEEGVRAITTNCGYFGNYQKEAVSALKVPVFLSSLLQIPFISNLLSPDQRIGVICSNAESLTPQLLSSCGVSDPSNLVTVGVQNLPESKYLWSCTGHFNSYKIEQELVNLATQLINNNPDIAALLIECSEIPPYSWSIQKAVNLPVFDFTTMINFVFSAVVRRPFSGYI